MFFFPRGVRLAPDISRPDFTTPRSLQYSLRYVLDNYHVIFDGRGRTRACITQDIPYAATLGKGQCIPIHSFTNFDPEGTACSYLRARGDKCYLPTILKSAGQPATYADTFRNAIWKLLGSEYGQ